jgi:putative acetyltransferase
MGLVIAVDDPRRGGIPAVLEQHLIFSRMVTPASGVHALALEGLLDPAVTFFSARLDGELVGVGALKQLDKTHVELKSMHTVQTARRQGVGRALVEHLLSVAADRNYRRVSLETGAMDAFAPARTLYAQLGFRPCPPFGQYIGSPTSACMTIELRSGACATNERREWHFNPRRPASGIPEAHGVFHRPGGSGPPLRFARTSGLMPRFSAPGAQVSLVTSDSLVTLLSFRPKYPSGRIMEW